MRIELKAKRNWLLHEEDQEFWRKRGKKWVFLSETCLQAKFFFPCVLRRTSLLRTWSFAQVGKLASREKTEAPLIDAICAKYLFTKAPAPKIPGSVQCSFFLVKPVFIWCLWREFKAFTRYFVVCKFASYFVSYFLWSRWIPNKRKLIVPQNLSKRLSKISILQ